MTFGSLFAGIGGMDLGLERSGMECRWQVEIDPFCNKVLEKHWPNVKRYGDITEVDGSQLEPVDLIAGGFPCQDLSVAGLRLGIKDGTRSGLWSEFARLIGSVRPRLILIENVAGLLANEPMRRVLGDLSALGFDAEWESIPAASVGAPHQRERIFIFAYSKSERLQRSLFYRTDLRMLQRSSPALFGNRNIHVGGWWKDRGDIRMGDGLRCRMDRGRIRALGNAVSPQVAEWIGRRIMAIPEPTARQVQPEGR